MGDLIFTGDAVRVSRGLSHHGILGQKWGVRRFQNSDGSLTEEGKKRYYDRMDLSKKVSDYERTNHRKYKLSFKEGQVIAREERSFLFINFKKYAKNFWETHGGKERIKKAVDILIKEMDRYEFESGDKSKLDRRYDIEKFSAFTDKSPAYKKAKSTIDEILREPYGEMLFQETVGVKKSMDATPEFYKKKGD